jgi:CheY-like chemotaxis protein
VQVLEREEFDLICMDVQMPVMGGLEATTAIREREGSSGRHVPILGLTAHAMKADLERCLEAGMDDVVTKPIKVADLVAAIERLQSSAPEVVDLAAAAVDEGLPLLDLALAEENTCGDPGLLAEIAGLFPAASDAQLSALAEAYAGGDVAGVERAAHSLRGSLSTLGALRAAAAAEVVETRAGQGDLVGAAGALDALVREVAGVRPAIERLGAGELPRAA